MNSAPRLDSEEKYRLVPIDGSPPDLLQSPAGCRFAPRCRHAMRICREVEPPLVTIGEGHQARCFLHHPAVLAVPDYVKVN
jgi:oligopeptide transport system ATP-binding protein